MRIRNNLKSGERTYLIHVAAATLLVFLAGVFSAVTIPYFGGPDERNHYNSVVRVLDGGGWPLPYTAGIEPSVDLAWLESGRSIAGEPVMDVMPLAQDRSSVLTGVDLDREDIDNMVQHPPLYYFLTAGVVAATDLDNLRWDQAMLLMRIVAVLLVSIAVPAIAGSIRLIASSRSLGAIGAYALLSIPFFTGFAGLVSNDTLLVPTISGALYLLIRAWKSSSHTVILFIASGAIFGLALLTKGFALFAIPLVLSLSTLAAFSGGAKRKNRLILSLIPSIVAALVGGWWWVRNIVLVGSIQPSVAGNLRIPLDEPLANINIVDYFASLLLRFNSLFWSRGVRGDDGGEEIPVAVVGMAGVVLVLGLMVVVIFSRNRGATILLLSFPGIIMAILFANSYKVYETFGVADRGVQGRYVYGGILAYSMVIAGFFGILGRNLSHQLRSWLFALVIFVSAAIAWGHNWWLLLTAWPNAYSSTGSPAQAASNYFGIPSLTYLAITCAALVILVAVFVASSRLSGLKGFASDMTDMDVVGTDNEDASHQVEKTGQGCARSGTSR